MSKEGKRTLQIVSPVAEPRRAEQGRPVERNGLRGKVVVALPSQKSSSPPFINGLVERMKGATAATQVFSHNPEWPYFHPTKSGAIPAQIDEVSQRCDAAVVGIAY